MLLLDRLLSCTASEGTADALIAAGNLFRLPDDTIHAAALFELMAQAYAAVQGFQNSLAGKPVAIGYLAGINRAVVHGAARVGDRLVVSVRQTALLPPFVRAEARVAAGRRDARRGGTDALHPARGGAAGVSLARGAIVCLVLAATAPLQAAGPQEEVLARLARNAAGIETVQGRVLQEKRLEMFKDTVVSRGRFAYRRPRPTALGVDRTGRHRLRDHRARPGAAGTA